MIIYIWHKGGSCMSIRRAENFDVQDWANKNIDNFRILNIVRISYDMI